MTFKFSKQTKTIIENFKNINPTMLFRVGSELRTYNTTNLLGVAQIEETIPKEFGIYDLSKLLSILSVFGDPTIKFNDSYLTISNSDDKKYDFRFTALNMIVEPPTSVPDIDPLVQFELSKKNLNELIKVVSISKHPEVAFIGEGGKLSVQAIDPKGATADTYQNILGTTDKTFKVRLKYGDLTSLMSENYNVILAENACLFDAPTVKLKYYIAPEAND